LYVSAQWKDAGEKEVRMILMVDQGTQYRPPPLAKFFHALPHVNISLHLVNSTFNPDSDIYLEVMIVYIYLFIYTFYEVLRKYPGWKDKHSIQHFEYILEFL
jgi:hypothetical protein